VTVAVEYLQIVEGTPLPDITRFAPFRAVIILDDSYSGKWQDEVSDWLVASGCLYMMAWGEGCSSWDDSVDFANLRQFDFGEIPDDHFVMTTWHDKEPIEEAFRFAQFCATHPNVNLDLTLLIHVSAKNSQKEMMERFKRATNRQ
jgi:hypothetical protein